MHYTIIKTLNDLGIAKCEVPTDQSAELEIGCEYWPINVPGIGTGCITVWPETRRAAVCWGGDSHWGDWDSIAQTIDLDDPGVMDDGSGSDYVIDADGRPRYVEEFWQ